MTPLERTAAGLLLTAAGITAGNMLPTAAPAETIPAPAAAETTTTTPTLVPVCRRTSNAPGGTGIVGEQIVPHIPPDQYDDPPGPGALFFLCDMEPQP